MFLLEKDGDNDDRNDRKAHQGNAVRGADL